MLKAAIYARVSTSDQTCELQLRELREYCARRGWEIVGEYVDTGWSGAKKSRPEFDKLLAAAQAHHFDAILVWKLDRFGRSVLHLSQALNDLRSWGVRFMATSQNIDTDEANPVSRLLLHILAAVAEFEREMIKERVAAGVKNAKAKGIVLGRKRRVFARYQVAELRAAGKSLRAIAAALGVSLATIQREIANPEEPQNGVSKSPPKTPKSALKTKHRT